MNVIKVRMQSSYMCGIIMRRIGTLLRGRVGMITIRYRCFHMFFYMYIFFSYSPIFLFSHKTMPRCRPETHTYILLSTMNDRSHPHNRWPRNPFTHARAVARVRRKHTLYRSIRYALCV